MNTSVSVVIPALNEKDNIGPLVDQVASSLTNLVSFEIVLVDDCSTDNTFSEFMSALKRNHIQGRAIRLLSTVGQSSALHQGIHIASGEYIVTLDGDLQNDPADIPSFIKKAQEIGPDSFCIIGYRKNRRDTQWKRIQSKIANRVRSWLLRDGVPDTGCGLKMFPRKTFLQFPYFDHMHRYIPALVKRLGGSIYILEVNDRPRVAGVSKYTAWNRLWVGIADVLGVAWLIRRTKLPHVVQVEISQPDV